MIIIPPHTRTIYLNLLIGDSLKSVNKKYKLKLPELRFQIIDNYLNIFIINENKERCFLPFPNILGYSHVCLGDGVIVEDIEKAIEMFFNTNFTLAHIASLLRYVHISPVKCSFLDISKKIDEFYTKWQDSGNLELIKF